MDWTLISIVVTAIATCVMAYYTGVSSKLANEIKNQGKAHQERLEHLTIQYQSELSDLYQAIVIATVMSSNSNIGKVNDLCKLSTY